MGRRSFITRTHHDSSEDRNRQSSGGALAQRFHPEAELHPRPDNQMEVDAPPPAGTLAGSTPPPPPPPLHEPGAENAPDPPPGHPPGNPSPAEDTEDTEDYFAKHKRLWLGLHDFPNDQVQEKAELLFAYKISLGFIRAQNRSRCPFEYYTRRLLCHDAQHMDRQTEGGNV